MSFFTQIKQIQTIPEATQALQNQASITPNIQKAIDIATKAHEGQFRKSGAPYIVHPLCVAAITAFYGGDETMIIAALLHDVVEDTPYTLEQVSIEFGFDVAHLVDALTKIVEIRQEEFENAHNVKNKKAITAALTFRKMILASIKDIRAFVIKICDRMHNMLSLDSMPPHKQVRISEETLLVYAPIAHRLGISSLKTELEEICFRYLFPQEYEKIDSYIKENHQAITLKLNAFIASVRSLLGQHGFSDKDYEIESRIKRNYSIYLKMQRKGVEIDEILDLMAIRILVKDVLDCYKVLGILHLHLKPVVSRLKDYIAIPKENGYQTIHTTIFENANVFEVQIRTFDMHSSAQYGIAAHWKYKSGGIAPNLGWVENLQYQNNSSNSQNLQNLNSENESNSETSQIESLEEFYELAKNDLYKEDIVVFSPMGDTYSLPMGAVVLDFAYAVHTDVGNRAKAAFVNHKKASLLQPLKNSDIVRIITAGKDEIVKPRCSYINAVKTSKAKQELRMQYRARVRQIDRKAAINIIATMMEQNIQSVEAFLKQQNLDSEIYKIMGDRNFFKNIKNHIRDFYEQQKSIFSIFKFNRFMNRFKMRQIKLDKIVCFSNLNINEAVFDYCCHPKYGDEILGIKHGNKVYIHHKLCHRASDEIDSGEPMVFVQWVQNEKYYYKIIVALEDKIGSIAAFSGALAKLGCKIMRFSYDRMGGTFSTMCEIFIEYPKSDAKKLKSILEEQHKIIEFSALKDAYSGN